MSADPDELPPGHPAGQDHAVAAGEVVSDRELEPGGDLEPEPDAADGQGGAPG